MNDVAPTAPVAEGPAERQLTLARLTRAVAIATVAVCAALVAAKVVVRFDLSALWDDAYITTRYATNVLRTGRIAWNPGGEAVYGLTGPLILVLALPLEIVTRHNQALAATLTSAIAGVAAVTLMVLVLRRTVDASSGAKWGGGVLVAVCIALSATPDHFTSGMDTTFVIAYAALILLVFHRMEQSCSQRSAIVAGVVGGLAFWVRPDLLAYVLPVATLAVGAARRELRRAGLVALGICAAVLALIVLVNILYFHSPLPLPFYAKGTRLYGSSIWRAYQGVASTELVAFLTYYWPLLAIALAYGISSLRSRVRAAPLELGVLCGVLVCLYYYWRLALPVMYFSARFYQPTLPFLCWLSWRAIGRLERALGPAAEKSHLALLGCAGMLAAWTSLVPMLLTTLRDISGALIAKRVGHFDIHFHSRQAGPQSYWFRFDRFAALPDDLVIATTEVGMLGALAPDKVVLDLAGLNERSLAHGAFEAAWLFDRHPDVIYMPHPHYVEMIKAIHSSPAFDRYDFFDKSEIGAKEFGLAIWKDSPYYPAMRAIVDKKKRPSTTVLPR
jgi:hypothetical protein